MGQVERRKRVTRVQAAWHLADLLSVIGGFILGHLARFSPPMSVWFPPRPEAPPLLLYAKAGVVAAVLWIVLFHALDLYRAEGTRRGLRSPVLFRASLLGMLVNSGVAFFYRGESFSRLAAPIIWLFTFLLLRLLRRLFVRWLAGLGALPPIRFVLVGTGEAGLRCAAALPTSGMVPHQWVGVLRGSTDPPPPEGVDDLGRPEALPEIAESRRLDRVLIALPGSEGERVRGLTALCRAHDLDLDWVPDVGSPLRGPLVVEELGGLPVVRPRALPLAGWNGVVKRSVDLLLSSLLLLILSPLLLACSILVRIDSKGPILYRQQRMGRDLRVFEILKFRSMRTDAESTSGPVWATAADPRRTRAGRFLRTWSLDELPQLWNVLRGDMSLVGPRPERPEFVREFRETIPDYYGRHRIKSGLTGWAQVNGLRGDVPIEERTRFDLFYIENWSLWMDLRILFMTLRAVVTQRGS